MTTLVGGGTLPVGSILPFGGGAVPDGFLLCNGAQINRNDFAALFAQIGTAWGSGNGTTTFHIPTLNGNHIRGRAIGSGADPDRDSRTAIQTGGSTGDAVGSLQTWRVQSHLHSTYLRNAGSTSWYNGRTRGGFGNGTPITVNRGAFFTPTGSNAGPGWGANAGSIYGHNGGVNLNDGSPNGSSEFSLQSYYVNTNNTGSNQTTGQNAAVDFIIKY